MDLLLVVGMGKKVLICEHPVDTALKSYSSSKSEVLSIIPSIYFPTQTLMIEA